MTKNKTLEQLTKQLQEQNTFLNVKIKEFSSVSNEVQNIRANIDKIYNEIQEIKTSAWIKIIPSLLEVVDHSGKHNDDATWDHYDDCPRCALIYLQGHDHLAFEFDIGLSVRYKSNHD